MGNTHKKTEHELNTKEHERTRNKRSQVFQGTHTMMMMRVFSGAMKGAALLALLGSRHVMGSNKFLARAEPSYVVKLDAEVKRFATTFLELDTVDEDAVSGKEIDLLQKIKVEHHVYEYSFMTIKRRDDELYKFINNVEY